MNDPYVVFSFPLGRACCHQMQNITLNLLTLHTATIFSFARMGAVRLALTVLDRLVVGGRSNRRRSGLRVTSR